MKETWPDEIIHFIKQFSAAKETFLHGCCFWFAWILRERFNNRGYLVDIYHEPIENHFVARFYKYAEGRFTCMPRFYDVRGDVTSIYMSRNLEDALRLPEVDAAYYRHLMRDCRDFLPPVDVEAGNE